MTTWRVPVGQEQLGVLLELLVHTCGEDFGDSYTRKELAKLVLTVYYSFEQGWEWREGDES